MKKKSIELLTILRQALDTVHNPLQGAATIVLVVEAQGQVPWLQIEVFGNYKKNKESITINNLWRFYIWLMNNLPMIMTKLKIIRVNISSIYQISINN